MPNLVIFFGVYRVADNHLWSITVYTDTLHGTLVTVTVPVADRFGWTTFSAMERKRVSQIVNITAGTVLLTV